jgi:hypothetical protein
MNYPAFLLIGPAAGWDLLTHLFAVLATCLTVRSFFRLPCFRNLNLLYPASHLFIFHYGFQYNLPPPPTIPGLCFTAFTGVSPLACREYAAVMLNRSARNLLEWVPHTHLPTMLEAYNGPVYIQQVLPYVWHISPSLHTIIPGFRVSLLRGSPPPGWYGAGADPKFFSDSALYNVVLAMHMGDYTAHLQDQRDSTPYAVATHMLPFLKGMAHPPEHAPQHSHPVHVALERKTLRTVAHLLRHEWFGLFLRTSKSNYLQSHGAAPPIGVWNPTYVGKDLSRYKHELPPNQDSPRNSAPVWFVHDTLHHLSATSVGTWFDENPNLKHLVATAVIPPETVWDLPALRPALYDFTVVDGVLHYRPENDNGGTYQQPYSARQWLTSDRIITPRNWCLHLHLLETTYAHHVFVISRQTLIPEPTRTLDMPDLSIIPWMAHPTANLYQRLTSPSLATSLLDFGTRVPADFREIYSKVATKQATRFQSYPESYVMAAALYTQWVGCLRYETSPNLWMCLSFNLKRAFRLPFYYIPWVFQSWAGQLRQKRMDVPVQWICSTKVWVASSADTVLPGRDRCGSPVDLFQPPPSPDSLARFALGSARWCAWALVKFAGFAIKDVLYWIIPRFPAWWHRFTYLFDISWQHTALGLLFAAVLYWSGVRGPTVPLPRPLPAVKATCKRIYALAFVLPHAGLPFVTGLAWTYIIPLDYLILVTVWPKLTLHNIMRLALLWSGYADDDTVGINSLPAIPPIFSPIPPPTGPIVTPPLPIEPAVPGTPDLQLPLPILDMFAWLDWLLLSAAILCFVGTVVATIVNFAFRRGYVRPRHASHHDERDVLRPMPPPIVDLSDEERNLFLLPSPPSSGSGGAGPHPSSSSGSSSTSTIPPGAPVLPVVAEFDAESIYSATTQGSLPAPVVPIAPAAVADPFLPFAARPADFDDYALWRMVIAGRQPPGNNLDRNNMCVWDCLSAIFQLPPDALWACYLSSLSAADRFPYIDGLVPYEALEGVLNYFTVGYVVRGGTGDQNCPRGPGNPPNNNAYDPTIPPLMERASTKAWPQLHCFLIRNNDGSYHLDLHATAARGQVFQPGGVASAIGWVSRVVPRAEIEEVLNLPNKVFGVVYRRLQGTLMNMYGTQVPVRMPSTYVLPANPVREQLVTYTPTLADAQEALLLASDIKQKPATLELHDMNALSVAQALDQMAKQLNNHVQGLPSVPYPPVKFHLFHGMAGSGKTTALMAALLQQHARRAFTPSTLSFHTWHHPLREDLKTTFANAFPGCPLQNGNFKSLAMPLAQPLSGTLVLDDAGISWAGFIPLLLAANPAITDVYCTFDVTQNSGVFPEGISASRKNTSSASWLGRLSDYYATDSVRLSPSVSHLFGIPHRAIPGKPVTTGDVHVVTRAPAGVPLLVVSPRFAETQNMGGRIADTFQTCQGHTIHGDVCIDLGGLSATATENAAWTALTRATGNIYLVMGSLSQAPAAIEASWANSQILTALLTVASVQRTPTLTAQADVDGLVRSAVMSHLSRCLSPAAATRLGMPAPTPAIGSRHGVAPALHRAWQQDPRRSDVFTGRTYRATLRATGTSAPSAAFSRHTKGHTHAATDIPDIVRHFTALPSDSVLTVPNTEYVTPAPANITVLHDPTFDINDPTDDALRELLTPSGDSSFQHITDGAPDALHHTRADKVTDMAGMKKRIRVGQYNGSWTKNDTKRLKQLKSGVSKFVDMPGMLSDGFNPALLDECSREKLASWASKRTKRALVRSIDKQDLDQPHNVVRLFAKGQYIKKKAKWRTNAFPSQTVSDFSLGRIFDDAPFALYLEKQLLKHAHPTTYLHCRATPDQLSKWYTTHWRPGNVQSACDSTSWDSGMDHVFVEFVCWFMRQANLPPQYIDRYRYMRFNTSSHLGPHQPRQESGDRWTWLINTVCNLAFLGAMFNCPARTPIAASGDDGILLYRWRFSEGFAPSDWLLIPKLEWGVSLEFCGLIFGGDDISFDASVIAWRARFGLQQGRNDADYWRSIGDAINECAARLGNDSRMLASAAHYVDQAVRWFNLPRTLSIARRSQPRRWNSYQAGLLSSVFTPLRWLLFLT